MKRRRNKNDDQIQNILILLIAIVCIGYSTYQTANGYLLSTGNQFKAWTLSFIISGSLIALLYRLRKNLKEGKGLQALFIFMIYICFAFFSFLANFNSFFTESMKQELAYDELEKVQGDLASIKSRAINAIDEKNIADSIKTQVNLLKTTLNKQIKDKGLPGFGPKSKEIVKDINAILGVKLTEPAGTPELIAASISEQIDELLEDKLITLNEKPNVLKSGILLTLDNIQVLIDSAKYSIGYLQDDVYAIEMAVKAHNQIGGEVAGYINNPVKFNFERITSNIIDLGKISSSVQLANNSNRYNTGALQAIGLSAIIDLAVPFMLLIMNFGSVNKSRNQKASFPEREENPDSSIALADRIKGRGKN